MQVNGYQRYHTYKVVEVDEGGWGGGDSKDKKLQLACDIKEMKVFDTLTLLTVPVLSKQYSVMLNYRCFIYVCMTTRGPSSNRLKN